MLVEGGCADHVSFKDESQIRKMICSVRWFSAATWQEKFENFIVTSKCMISVPFIKVLWLCARLGEGSMSTKCPTWPLHELEV